MIACFDIPQHTRLRQHGVLYYNRILFYFAFRIDNNVITKAAVVCHVHITIEVYDSDRYHDLAITTAVFVLFLRIRFIKWKVVADAQERERLQKQKEADEAEALLVKALSLNNQHRLNHQGTGETKGANRNYS